MSKKINIVGSGSKLYKSVKLSKEVVIANEYRTSEVLHNKNLIRDGEVYIVFSLLTHVQLQDLFKETKSIVVIIGSCSALSKIANRFRYSKLKKNQLDFVVNNKKTNLKCVLFGDFKLEKERQGLKYTSYKNTFWSDILEAVKSNNKVIEAYKITGKSTLVFHLLSTFDRFLSPVSTLLIKRLTNYNYGYSNPALSTKVGR
jgi:hypothetical protein